MNTELYLAALGRVSAQAGVLVLLVLLAQWLFRRQLTPRWRCALWLLVVARLLLPFSPDSAASIFNLVPQWTKRESPSVVLKPNPSPSPAVMPGVENRPATGNVVPAIQPLPSSEHAAPDTTVHEQMRAVATHNPMPIVSAAAESPTPKALPWFTILFWVWLAGALILGVYVFVSSFRLAWRSRKLPTVSDPSVIELLDECGRKLGLRRQPALVECSDIQSPALFGLFRPRLLLPKGFMEKFSAQELRFVFLHELAHLKRWDLPLNWLVAVLQIVHWFNPLVWFGFARWRSDRELACDALALEAAGAGQNREYGRTILHLLENLTHRAPAPGLVGILEDKRQLHRRIRMIADFRPGKRWGWLSLALLVALAWVGLTDAQTSKSQPSKPGKTEITVESKSKIHREVRVGADPNDDSFDTNATMRSLTITVLAPDGKPLPGAEVHLPYAVGMEKPQPKRLTDEKGHFTARFSVPPKGPRSRMSNFSISASHRQFVRRSVMWTSSGGDVFDGMPEEVTIKLERGVPMGGVVRDERGSPLSGVRVLLTGSGYRGFTMGNTERKTHEYSEIWQDKESPAATTDASGQWRYDNFPGDINQVEVTFVRPDDSQETFATAESPYGINRRPLLALADLKLQKAVVVLKDGITVRGIVVDESGKPLPNVTVREGYGHGNIVRVGEFTTGADGRFERPNRAPRQWIYTASRPDRATVSVVAQVEPGMSEVRLVMPSPRPWRIEVVDKEGKPVPDAEITLDTYRTEAQVLDWIGTTDGNGIVVWTNAPTAGVSLYASTKSPPVSRKFKIAPNENGRRVVLSSGTGDKIRVRLKAVDAATRQPVKLASVGVQYSGDFKFRQLAEPNSPEFTAELNLSDVKVGVTPSYQFKLDAEGHETLTTEYYAFAESDQELELALNRMEDRGELTVLLPDGAPAVGAKLWVRTTPDAGFLSMHGTGRLYGNRLATEQTSDAGRVKLPGAPADAPVVITHADGFLNARMDEIRKEREVRLQSYGAVEGRLLVAAEPKHGANVSLVSLSWSPSVGFHLNYTARTDANGRFTFTQVPPGEYKLYRWQPPTKRRSSGPITETWQMPVTVTAGETNVIEYASAGRPVIGQTKADPSEMVVDWQADVHVLSLVLPSETPPGRPNREDYATFEAFRKANDASFRSETQLKQARNARTYQLEFEADGSFRVEDVPPGTYDLRIRVTDPTEDDRRRPVGATGTVVGSLTRQVIVPDGKEPFDLGTLTVPITGEAKAKSSERLELTASTLDGKPVSLAQFKGKYVLLAFWAAWSDRCEEQLAEFRKLESDYGPGGRLEILGVNVDDTLADARKTVNARSYIWPQAWLDNSGRAKASADFNVNTLPAIFLIDPEGRVAGRDLEGDRLRAAVKRALTKK